MPFHISCLISPACKRRLSDAGMIKVQDHVICVGLPVQNWPSRGARNQAGYAWCAGDGEDELALLELVCNPNAYSTAFDAKVLVTLKTAGGVSVTTEGRLSAIKSDIDTFAEQHK